ncbi:MAG: ankyrin repeat domain-containing protein [Campylobacter sp.]|nr:ankyrin repeat domain-containing protein [Campylobacter sp.]
MKILIFILSFVIFGFANECENLKNTENFNDAECKNSYFNTRFLDKIQDLSTAIRGSSIDCVGMRALEEKKAFNSLINMATISPEIYKTTLKDPEISDKLTKKNREYFQFWAYKSIYNYHLFSEFNAEYKQIVPKLVEYYRRIFGYDEGSAIYFANRVANEFLFYAVGDFEGEYKLSELEKIILNPLLSQADLETFLITNSSFISPSDLSNALNIAIIQDNGVEVLQTLLRAGARLNSLDESAIFFALVRPKYIDFLLQNGADINYANSIGKTPLFYAVDLKSANLVRFLLQRGANPNATLINNAQKLAKIMENSAPFYIKLCGFNATSKSLFMHAASSGDMEIVQILFETGANIDAVDDDGKSAYDYAKNEKIKDYILNLKGENR